MAQQCHPSSHGTPPWPSRSQSSEESMALGFTFTPTDEQLIVHYLHAYAAGQSLRWDRVVEAQVYSTDPWSLLGDDGEIGYFLTKRTRHGNRVKRTASRGTWTGQTKKKEIVSAAGQVIGFKAMFSFCIGDGDDRSRKPPSKKTTGYVMYEYELPSTANQPGTRRQGELQEPVLCCIKKSAREIARSHKRKREEAAARSPAAAETNAAASVRDVNNVNLVSNGPLGRASTAVDRQQLIPYHGKNAVTAIADFFEAGECSYNSTIFPEYADSVTSAADGTITMALSPEEREMANGDINLACHGALGMTANDYNLQPIPYPRRWQWMEMMDADIFYALPGDVDAGDIVGSTAVEGAGDRQPPDLLPCELELELDGTTTAAATADHQLLLAPDQDEQTAVGEADDLDWLLSELAKEDYSDWFDSWLTDEPSPPPALVDSEMLSRNCQMLPPASSDGALHLPL